MQRSQSVFVLLTQFKFFGNRQNEQVVWRNTSQFALSQLDLFGDRQPIQLSRRQYRSIETQAVPRLAAKPVSYSLLGQIARALLLGTAGLYDDLFCHV